MTQVEIGKRHTSEVSASEESARPASESSDLESGPHRSAGAEPSTAAELPLQVVRRDRGATPTGHRSRWVWLLPVVAAVTALALFFLRGSFRFGAVEPASGESSAADGPGAPGTLQAPIASARSVFALGRLEPEGEIMSVAAPSGSSDARVETIGVREGDPVSRGDVLAVLDNEPRLQAALLVATRSVELAGRRIERTRLEVETTRSQLQASLRAAQSRLALQRSKMQRSEQLLQASAETAQGFDQQELDLKVAEDAVQEAEARLKRYDQPADDSGDARELVDIRLSELELASAEAQMEQARANLEQAFVRAPADGRILKIHLQAGERIGQSTLLELGSADQMMARVEVYESDLPAISAGQQVRITASVLKKPLTGTVDRITPLFHRQELISALPAANTDARVIDVWVRLDEAATEATRNLVNLQVRAEFLP